MEDPSRLAIYERYRPIVDEWEPFFASLSRPLPPTIWHHPSRIAPAALVSWLAEDDIHLSAIPWYDGAFRWASDKTPGQHIAYAAGLYHIQEEASLLPVLLLDPQPGERILDLCAAPGGKTAQIAFRLKSQGTVIANDRSYERLKSLSRTQERLGLTNLCMTLEDAANYPRDTRPFDRILADVPCSCDGTVRKKRNQGLLRRLSLLSYESLGGLQTAILRKAVALCRPSGRIVYSTCSLAPEENERVIDTILREFGPSLRLLPASLPSFRFSPGLTSWKGQAFSPEIEKALRVWPHHNDTGGFFAAILERTEIPFPPHFFRQRPAQRPSSVSASPLETPTSAAPQEPLASSLLSFPPLVPLPEDEGMSLSSESSVLPSLAPTEGGASSWRITQDGQPRLRLLEERFGLTPEVWASYSILAHNSDTMTIADKALQPPTKPSSQIVGMSFLRISQAYPKLTTAAALLLGSHATKGFLELDEARALAYARRQDIEISDEESLPLPPRGYVLLRYRGFLLGLGLLRSESGKTLVESAYPKAWALPPEDSGE